MIRRALAALLGLVSASAFAVNVGVNVSYTPNAAAYAASLSTSVTAMVAAQIATANASYAASGIDIVLVQEHDPLPSGPSAPKDSAPMQAQYEWARNNPDAITQRGDSTGSSISIQISDPGAGASFDGVMTAGAINSRKDAVAALPIRGVAGSISLELTISKIIGSDPAYARRENLYGWEGYGPALCVHTRESTTSPIATSTPVPNLTPLYSVPFGPWSTVDDNGAPTTTISCSAFQAKLNSTAYTGCASGACASSVVSGTSPSFTCTLKNTAGANTVVASMLEQHPTGSAPITCTESWTNTYSTPTRSFEGRAMGDSTHDSVSKMNARKTTVSNWSIGNRDVYKRALEGTLGPVRAGN